MEAADVDDARENSVPYFFPDDHPVRFTLQVFPHSGGKMPTQAREESFRSHQLRLKVSCRARTGCC